MDAAVSKPHVKERKVTYKTIYTQNEYVLENDYGLFGGLRLDAGERKQLLTHKSRSENLFSGFFIFEDTKWWINQYLLSKKVVFK